MNTPSIFQLPKPGKVFRKPLFLENSVALCVSVVAKERRLSFQPRRFRRKADGGNFSTTEPQRIDLKTNRAGSILNSQTTKVVSKPLFLENSVVLCVSVVENEGRLNFQPRRFRRKADGGKFTTTEPQRIDFKTNPAAFILNSETTNVFSKPLFLENSVALCVSVVENEGRLNFQPRRFRRKAGGGKFSTTEPQRIDLKTNPAAFILNSKHEGVLGGSRYETLVSGVTA